MEKFEALVELREKVKTIMSAVCVGKGGIDIDNYSGRFFAADMLELVIAFGEKAGANVAGLKKELDEKRNCLTPPVKPIYEMTLAEFEKLIGESDKE
jgi:hypothetical protein